MKKRTRLNILHWPSAYTEPEYGKPFDQIFVQEHIASIATFTYSKVLYVSQEPCKKGWYEKSRQTENGVDTIRLYFSKNLPLQFLNVLIRVMVFVELLKLWLFEGFKPNIIHVHFYQSVLWAAPFASLLKAKLFITEHWTAFIGYPIISEARFAEAAKAFEAADYVLLVSHHLAMGIKEKTGVNIHHKDAVIHNSVDTTLFQYQQHKSNPVAQLLYVGRMDPQKNIPLLLRVIHNLSKRGLAVHLTLIGGGTSIEFEQLATDLRIEKFVSFKGIQSKQVIASYMQQSDLLLLTSIAENSPSVIGEALCCGLPVVSTQVGGIPELLNESNGHIINSFDVELYADAVVNMLDKNWDRKSIAATASTLFSREAIGAQIFKAYQTVC